MGPIRAQYGFLYVPYISNSWWNPCGFQCRAHMGYTWAIMGPIWMDMDINYAWDLYLHTINWPILAICGSYEGHFWSNMVNSSLDPYRLHIKVPFYFSFICNFIETIYKTLTDFNVLQKRSNNCFKLQI